MACDDAEPVYMDKRVLAFMRAWPADRDPAVWHRMVESRMVATTLDDATFATYGACLTNLGHEWLKIIGSQSINFFSIKLVLGMWPIDLLANRRDDIGVYLGLFSLDWNTPDVRRYIAKGLQDRELVSLARNFPADPIRRSLAGKKGLKQALSDLDEAMMELRYQLRLEQFKLSPDSEIPF